MVKKFLSVSFIFTILLFPIPDLKSQANVKDSLLSFPLISASLGMHLPGNDLVNRFGPANTVGGSILFKRKSNFIYGIQGQFIFGNEIRDDDPLKGMRTKNGSIITGNGTFADVRTLERGYYFLGEIGRILPIIGPNKNSGLLISGGIGFMQHKIRIEVKDNDVPQLNGNYKKGYDRLTNGISFNQFLGYVNFSNSRTINFYCGFDLSQAFTMNRRDINFDTNSKDETKRLDTMFGLKIGWIIPIYRSASGTTYFY